MKRQRLLTEQRIREIVTETVNEVLGRMDAINEMAIPLSDYRKRVDNLRFQLVENWCLCKWCQIFSPECTTFNHWMNKLKACITNLKFIDIKKGISKRKTIIRMLIDDYDYDKPGMILRIISDKFDIENITDNDERIRVAKEFSLGIRELIDVISIDSNSVNLYMTKTFHNE